MRKKNNSGYQAARKKATRGADQGKLDKLGKELRCNGFLGTREFPIFNKDGVGIRNADIRIHTDEGPILVELDGFKVHGAMDRATETPRTTKRNMDYVENEKDFVICNEALADTLGLDWGKLTTYLLYHEMSKMRARRKLENG